jgi:hypothetical protein
VKLQDKFGNLECNLLFDNGLKKCDKLVGLNFILAMYILLIELENN